MPDLTTDNSTNASMDNPATEPVVGSSETGATSGQALEATPAGDLFKGVDPNRLPPEARAAYNSMLTDYRDKTTKLSETIKSEIARATEEYQQKANFYDQIATQEEFVKKWNDYVQEVQSKSQGQQQEGDPVLTQMKQQLQEMNQKMFLSEMSQVTDAFADAVNEKGDKLHPEFDQLNSISVGSVQSGQETDEYSLLRGCIELAQGNSPQEKLVNGYKTAKSVYDSIFETGKKSGMGRLQMKVLNGSNPPSNSSGDVLSVTTKKPKNAHEALEMARRGQVVSRE